MSTREQGGKAMSAPPENARVIQIDPREVFVYDRRVEDGKRFPIKRLPSPADD